MCQIDHLIHPYLQVGDTELSIATLNVRVTPMWELWKSAASSFCPTSLWTAKQRGPISTSFGPIGLVLQFWLIWFAMLLELLEMLARTTFETWCNFFGVWPSLIFPAQNSAVIVFNAEGGECPKSSMSSHIFTGVGIGRSTALKYSELGYTVFALCPSPCCETLVTANRQSRSSNVSSASSIQYILSKLRLILDTDSTFVAS